MYIYIYIGGKRFLLDTDVSMLMFWAWGEHQSVYLFSFWHRGPPWRLTNFNEQSLSFHWSIEGVLTCKAFPMNWLKSWKQQFLEGSSDMPISFEFDERPFSWVHPNRCFYDLYAWLTTEPHEDLMKQRKKLRNRKARLYSTIYENCWSASAIKKVASTTTAGAATTYTLDVTTTPTWMI